MPTPGKAYTMRELRQIVNYLKDNKLYSEVRGRKMWQDWAKTGQIDRTWQSLKETFLKRILPDIHNPYYELTIQEISSFRQGYDVETKSKAKLDIRPISDSNSDSNSAGNDKTDYNQASTSKIYKKNEATGEVTKCTKIQTRTRSSTETLILEQCSESGEENEDRIEPKRSVRDLITYTEPLTPMMQELLDDFATDEDESPMADDRETCKQNGHDEKSKSKSPVSIRESRGLKLSVNSKILSTATEEGALNEKNDEGQSQSILKIKSLKLKKTRKGTWENKSGDTSDSSLHQEINQLEKNNNQTPTVTGGNANDTNITSNHSESITEESRKNLEQATQIAENFSNSTTDSLLPNNQEALATNCIQKHRSNESSKADFEIEKKKKTIVTKGILKNHPSNNNKDKILSTVDVDTGIVQDKDKVEAMASTDVIDLNNEISEVDLVTPENNTDNQTSIVDIVTTENDTEPQNTQQTIDIHNVMDIEHKDKRKNSNEHNSQEAGPSGVVKNNNPDEINPCLKSVSLFAEQFSQAKYSDSDFEDNASDKTKSSKKQANEQQQKNVSDICVTPNKVYKTTNEKVKETAPVIDGNARNIQPNIRSNIKRTKKRVTSIHVSDSDRISPPPKKRNTKSRNVSKVDRDAALANVFGFVGGGASRKRSLNQRKHVPRQSLSLNSRRSIHNVSMNIESGSNNEYSTLSDSEENTRSLKPADRHRHARKYAKPNSYDVVTKSDPAAKYLFVHNKMHPIVRHSNATERIPFYSDSESDEVEYWKKKYQQEKKRTAEESIRADELARLLHSFKELTDCKCKETEFPIQRSIPNPSNKHNVQKPPEDNDKPHLSSKESKESFIKIKWTPHNEIEVECNTPQMESVLELLSRKRGAAQADAPAPRAPSSGVSTPVPASPRTQEKVTIMENEIFREIVENHQVEPPDAVMSASDTNVTMRKRGRPKQTASPILKKSLTTASNDQELASTATNIKRVAKSPKTLQKEKNVAEKTLRSATKKNVASIESDAIVGSNDVDKLSGESSKRQSSKKAEATKAIRATIRTRSMSMRDVTNATSSKKAEKSLKTPAKVAMRSKSLDVRRSLSGVVSNRLTRAQKITTSIHSLTTMVDKRSRSVDAHSSTSSVTSSGRIIRTPKKFADDELHMERRYSVNKSRSRSNSTARKLDVIIPEDDSQVRYMFPKSGPASRSSSRGRAGPSPSGSRSSSRSRQPAASRGRSRTKKSEKASALAIPRIISPDNSSRHSIESSAGYQDSDDCLPNMPLRKKRKLSLSTLYYRTKRQLLTQVRRKSYPYLPNTCESNQSFKSTAVSMAIPNSSLNTDIYRSESYQLLMPKIRPFEQLGTIEERNFTQKEVAARNTKNFNFDYPLAIKVNIQPTSKSNSSKIEGNSSNISPPLSPELSIVENISIDKDMLGNVVEHPTINETQGNDESRPELNCNKCFIPALDISVPLMAQNCQMETTQIEINSGDPTSRMSVCESPLYNITTVNPEEQTLSDSLGLKLRNLFLESAKKIANQMRIQNHGNNKENLMEVDTNSSKEQKKTRSKKRSSTPRKKTELQKLNAPNVQPVIEEHVESCSKAPSGRKSCPPPSVIVTNSETVNMGVNSDESEEVAVTSKRKSRTKKDVIKVKIQRPRDKSLSKRMSNKSRKTCSPSRVSVCTDSGINETGSGVFLQGCDDSVELIHNHSETCLHANECIGNSVEFVSNEELVICVNSSSEESESFGGSQMSQCCQAEVQMPELFCNNAQEATSLNAVKPSQETDIASGGASTYSFPSRPSFNSLITEDLSDELSPKSQPRPSQWYLLGDEDTTNSTFHNSISANLNTNAGVGANLNQLFPLACAVPNLSTITEYTENGSRKPILDESKTDSQVACYSPSIFDISL